MSAPPGILEVRCAGCGETLEVEHGLTEFACPDCSMAQALPPELMPPRPRRALPLPGRVAPYDAPAAPVALVRVSCGGCGSVLSVPHGPGRFACPLCGAELASSPLAAVPVVTTPAAVPISSTRFPNQPEVHHGPSSQSARAGMVQKPTHSEQTHGQHPNHYLGEESFSSFRATSRTQNDAVRRLQNEALNPSVHREEPHTEPVQRTIARPGKKRDRFVIGPKLCQEGNVQEEQPNQVESTKADPAPSSTTRYPCPQAGSIELDNIDATPEPTLNHGVLQAEQSQHCYSQTYSPETGWALPNPSSNSRHQHEIHRRFNQIDHLDKNDDEVPPTLAELPPQCSSPTTPQHQPKTAIYSQDAQCDDIPSGSLSKSSKKRRGRPTAVLMEPRKEADRPVLTPNGTDWSVHPPGPKVATTLSLLIKQNYPGTCISVDTDGRSCEVVVHYWHQCPPDVKSTLLDEFLKRYKWSPGQEKECQKIFERKAVRQLRNLFCYEKQRVREELAAKKSRRYLKVRRAGGERALEKGDVRKDSEEGQGDESVGLIEPDDPLNWKPFVPDWMQRKWWEMLCDHWAKDEYMKVSYQQRKNRNAGSHPRDAADSPSTTTHQQSMDTTYHTEETSDTPLGPRPVQEQVGSSKRERRYSPPVVSKKAQTDSSSKSSPDCLNKQRQQSTSTQEQVQQMISQALQGLNETWERKFLSLEQNMRRC